MKTEYDVVVIGAGPGGYVLALDCARRGLSVALVDKGMALGGTCLNVGCIPSKALLESSELFYRMKNESAEHGIIEIDGKERKDGRKNTGDSSGASPDESAGFSISIATMMKRKDAVVNKLTGGIASLMKARGVDVIRGRAMVTAPGELRVDLADGAGSIEAGKAAMVKTDAPVLLKSPRIVLATGSVPTALPALPFDGKQVLDSTDALALEKVPKSLAVIGAGAVGLELGSVWSRLGAEVTVIEAMDQIIPGADSQAARGLAAALKKQGITIKTGTMVENVKLNARSVDLEMKDKKGNLESLKVEKVLVAVGRRASWDSALSESISPELTGEGRFVKVDESFSTSIEGLYAIGDLVGNPMLAHKAEEEALALAALFAGEKKPPWGGPIPGIVYTDPELAWAGESEESLKAGGADYIKGQFPFAANGRALAAGGADGFVKLLSSPNDGRLLGAVILGRGASELIGETVTVMAMGGSAEDIALTVHGHPTLSETVKEAALVTIGRPLHRS